MIKPFDSLYSELEKALRMADKQLQGPEKYLRGIELSRDKVGRLHTMRARYMQSKPKEITFFRDVWPAFYAKLFLYIWLYGLELRRGSAPVGAWSTILEAEEARVQSFLRDAGEFWQYYRSGAPVLDEQFTRTYSRGLILEPLALVVDPEGVTLASYRAACCLAMQGLGEWLQEERAQVAIGVTSAADMEYSWGGSDADLAEWLFGIQAVGAIQYKGQPADLSRLQKWARLSVGREVSNIYDRGRVLRNRKKERLAFTKKTASALEKKWDRADGKFE